MKVKDLNGKEYDLNISKKKSRVRSRSGLFLQAQEVFKQEFPTLTMCTEVAVKIKPGLTLYLDMFIPILSLAIEVHGEQHFKFTPHYHKNETLFYRARLNDDLKREWCEINQIQLLELNYDESAAEWTAKLRKAIR